MYKQLLRLKLAKSVNRNENGMATAFKCDLTRIKKRN